VLDFFIDLFIFVLGRINPYEVAYWMGGHAPRVKYFLCSPDGVLTASDNLRHRCRHPHVCQEFMTSITASMVTTTCLLYHPEQENRQ
jgi:hypothetical protein